MSDSIQEKWREILLSLMLLWSGWMSVTIIRLEAQQQAMQLLQSNVIPPVIEQSFKEIRDKGNVSSEKESMAMKVALENQRDISYMREDIKAIKESVAKKP